MKNVRSIIISVSVFGFAQFAFADPINMTPTSAPPPTIADPLNMAPTANPGGNAVSSIGSVSMPAEIDRCPSPGGDNVATYVTWGSCERDRNLKNYILTTTSRVPLIVGTKKISDRLARPIYAKCINSPEAFGFITKNSEDILSPLDWDKIKSMHGGDNHTLDFTCMAKGTSDKKYYLLSMSLGIKSSCLDRDSSKDWIKAYFDGSDHKDRLFAVNNSPFNQTRALFENTELPKNCYVVNSPEANSIAPPRPMGDGLYAGVQEITREQISEHLAAHHLKEMDGIKPATADDISKIQTVKPSDNKGGSDSCEQDGSAGSHRCNANSAAQVEQKSDRSPASEKISPTHVRFDIK